MEQEITLEKILAWVTANSNDTEAMDKLNYITYPYTSKYKERGQGNRRPLGKRTY